AKLAEVAFSSPQNAKRLNSIIHPALASDILPGLTEMGLLLNPPPLVVLDVPMLVEAPVFGEFADIILAISVPEETRIERSLDRGMDEADARRRAACQSSEEDRIMLADRVIVNVGTEEDFIAELDKFWDDVVESED
ncbi:MAG: dephospho-CoA kinase, partial [Coriobacteriia bacterium]|nr:dephospho-CoA kinase [Coriobacteriia bacterium]